MSIFDKTAGIKDQLTFTFNINEKIITRMKKLYSIPYETFVDAVWETYDDSYDSVLDKTKWYNNPLTYHKRLTTWLSGFIMPKSKIQKNKFCKETMKYARNKTGGRTYSSKFGFQSLHRKIRNYIFHDTPYWDYDMVNCHFNILKYFLDNSCNITADQYPMVTEYCKNRSACLAQWECSKKDVLRMLNKDNYSKRENKYLQLFHKELKPLKRQLISEYPKICSITTNKQNPNSSLCDYLLCYAENKVLQYIMNHFENSACPFFDGYIGYTKVDIEEINALTADWGITWSIKPFENELTNVDELVINEIFKNIGSDPLVKATDFFEFLKTAGNIDIARYYMDNVNDKRVLYTRNGWYEYTEKNILHHYGKQPPITFPTRLSKYFNEVLKTHYIQCIEHQDANSDAWKKVESVWSKWHPKFNDVEFFSKVIKGLQGFLYDEKIQDKIDTQPHLLCFEDGMCVDFENAEIRKVKKSDYILSHLDYALPKENKEIQDDICNIIKGMFDNEKVYDFVLDHIGYSLFTNRFEKFYIWNGSGRNGKGVLTTLVNGAFGKYFMPTSTKFLSKLHNKSTFDSDLANAKGKKLLMLSEPESEAGFNLTKIKSITGRDEITTREVGGKNFTYKPHFTTICQCNNIPSLDDLDTATLERMVVIQFNYTFVGKDVYNPNNKQHKLGDTHIKDKVSSKAYAHQFMCILIKRMLKKYNDELSIPEAVQLATDGYIDENNPIKDFVEMYLQHGENKTTPTIKHPKGLWNIYPATDLFNKYKEKVDEFASSRKFYKLMKDNGYIKVKKRVDNKTIRGYVGLEDKKFENNCKVENESDDDDDDDDDSCVI